MLDEFLPAAPVLLLLVGGVVSVILEGAVSRLYRGMVQPCFTVLILLGTLGWSLVNWVTGRPRLALLGAVSLDGPTWFAWTLLLVFAMLAALLFAERRIGGGESPFAPNAAAVPSSQLEREAIAARQEHTEIFALLMFSVAGMMAFVAANDLLTMFVALEVFSFPLYVLAGMARRRRLLSQEASLKYFLLGALSSGIFLYGTALLYGFAGGFSFALIDARVRIQVETPMLLFTGMTLVIVGVLFKLGTVPFHNWVPDVYCGAPSPVTAFMAVCTKIAAAFGLLRLLFTALGGMVWDWQVPIAMVAVLTMAVGAVIGLRQEDIKRMLAYSSIAHAGFILVAVVGAQAGSLTRFAGAQSVPAVGIYLSAYGLATMGAFAIVTLVRRSGSEANGFTAWAGLGRRNPLLGVLMTVFLLSMAGIPLTGGFVGKMLAFLTGWSGGYGWLVLLAVIFSLVTAGFYFRVVWIMFGKEPNTETAVVSPGSGTLVVIWCGVAGTLLLGVLPGPLMQAAAQAATFVR